MGNIYARIGCCELLPCFLSTTSDSHSEKDDAMRWDDDSHPASSVAEDARTKGGDGEAQEEEEYSIERRRRSER